MATRRTISRFDRVNQWLQFARQWHIIDANHQDANKLGDKVAMHLMGKHKPIWHPETDCGDHVVVINCKLVAMHGFDWKHTLYHFNKEYPRSKADLPAWQIHEYDPCRIVFLSIYKSLGNNLIRRRHIQRLHLFVDEEMPEFIKRNLGNQLEQVQRVARRSDEYTLEERAAFPRLVKRYIYEKMGITLSSRFTTDHVHDWESIVNNPGRHIKPGPKDNQRK
uniref:39S ribosomal protein L13, mitochondrial n=1 Tax=Heterorhabditis bacteriophora TaxID=37862 RepID=A0A1I7XQK1_HETBA